MASIELHYYKAGILGSVTMTTIFAVLLLYTDVSRLLGWFGLCSFRLGLILDVIKRLHQGRDRINQEGNQAVGKSEFGKTASKEYKVARINGLPKAHFFFLLPAHRKDTDILLNFWSVRQTCHCRNLDAELIDFSKRNEKLRHLI